MIKNKEINPLKIIAVTADATKENKEKCLKLGFEEVLFKPIFRKILNRILKEYLSIAWAK